MSYCGTSSEASPGHANANLNHYHFSFLWKLIPCKVYKHRKICICMTKCRAGFATVWDKIFSHFATFLFLKNKKMGCI